MLTVENLKAVEGINDEQAAKIAELSKKDEDAVIGQKFGEVYRNLDSIIEKSTGIKRDGDEKTYVYLERAAKAVKETADTATKDIESLKAENEKLQKAIKDGASDTATKEKLAQTEKDLENVKSQYNALKGDFDKAKADYETKLFGVKVDTAVEAAFGGLKFKDGLTQGIIQMSKRQAAEKVKASNPTAIEDGNGGKILAFKDAEGAIMRNPDNNLNPYTVDDIVKKELAALGVLAQKRTQGGSGGNGGNGGGNGGSNAVDISGAKTQNEAYEIIAKQLFEKGFVNGTREFDEAMQKAWGDNNVSKLPR